MQIQELGIPVSTVYGIGRNYAEHAKELGNEVPSQPIVFLKPRACLVLDGGPMILPEASARVDHEVEIVIALGEGKQVVGYAVGIDGTARDFQDEAKKKGLPWAYAKGFPTSAPVSRFVPASAVVDPSRLRLQLEVNGQIRQQGQASQMLFSVSELLKRMDRAFPIEAGDVIFTGTPPGVGPMNRGDQLRASLYEGERLLTELNLEVR